jgi:hypothetical protein
MDSKFDAVEKPRAWPPRERPSEGTVAAENAKKATTAMHGTYGFLRFRVSSLGLRRKATMAMHGTYGFLRFSF